MVGVAICLFLQSGAVFAIPVMEPDGGGGAAGRSKLRLLWRAIGLLGSVALSYLIAIRFAGLDLASS